MEVVLASLIQHTIGQAPTKQGIIDIITSVGGKIDEKEIDTFITKLSGKNIDTLIEEGMSKISVLQAAAAPTPAAVTTGDKPTEKVEKQAPKPPAEDVDLFDDLFD
ncbi:60S acidic ribosomal protein P2 [Pseudoloma neurophilia]|uniref:60S acidic ribosomal protein P2 n=1 Tax=Pseudoloma neurophilia TaxID=146866 RepID=A0A0R0LXA0_9MICR|nr:60S acidic ribosomal protein P2 [Pseudoloma neurophilia]